MGVKDELLRRPDTLNDLRQIRIHVAAPEHQDIAVAIGIRKRNWNTVSRVGARGGGQRKHQQAEAKKPIHWDPALRLTISSWYTVALPRGTRF